MAWRISVQLRGGQAVAVDAADVAQLRALAARALANPDVTAYQWWHLHEVHGHPIPACACGLALPPHSARIQLCRCGLTHLVHHCRAGCGAHTADPPAHDGCGPLPHQPR